MRTLGIWARHVGASAETVARAMTARATFRERNESLARRVRDSEAFPRIRDAEAIMAEEHAIYLARIDNKKRKQIGKLPKPLPPRTLTHEHKSPAKRAEAAARDYFSSHVLNKDPACSKYMPFDVVHFPKLFDSNESSYAPESIDFVWMLGFQHLSEHASKIVPEGPRDLRKKQAKS